MEKFKISKEKLIKIQDIVIFILLLLWMIMPILQTFKVMYKIINFNYWYFSLMKTIGVVGIILGTINIYYNIKNAENKKEAIKGVLPILIFVLYMIWTLISCYQANIKRNAFQGSTYRREGYYMYLNYAGYFLCAFLLKNKKLRKILLNVFVISSIYLISISRITLDGARYRNIFTNMAIQTTVFKQFNHYGYFLMMSLLCSLGLFMAEKNKFIKTIYLILYTIIGYALIYNYTFGCYLAVTIFLIAYSLYAFIRKKDRIHILVAIVIFVVLSCLTTKNGVNIAQKNITEFTNDIKSIINKINEVNSENKEQNEIETQKEINTETGMDITADNNEQLEEKKRKEVIENNFQKAGSFRMQIWLHAIEFILEKPIIGYGPDNLEGEYLQLRINQDRPHNLIIYLACVSGIPGMLLYVTAVGIIVVKGIKKLFSNNSEGTIYLIVVITYLISSMFGNSMYYTSPYFFIFLGSLMQCNLIKKEE